MAVKSDIPNPGSKATLYGLGGDVVAILHNPNPAHRSPMAMWISFDGMKTWPYRRVLQAVRQAFEDYGFDSDEAELRANATFAAGIGFLHLSGPTPDARHGVSGERFLDLMLRR